MNAPSDLFTFACDVARANAEAVLQQYPFRLPAIQQPPKRYRVIDLPKLFGL